MALSVGERVQARIAELHTNSAEVARKAGLERTFVHDLISGRKKTVTAEALISLALALNCLPEELVGKRGIIPRDSFGNVEIIGVVEPDVWRGSMPRNLGSISTVENVNDSLKAFVTRGNDAMPLGVRDGSALIVEMGHPPHFGDLVVVERTREELREYSLRRVVEVDGQMMLATPDADPSKIISLTASRPGETTKVVGRVQRAILMFPSAIS